MNIDVCYKTTIINIQLDETAIKISNFKIGLKNSLIEYKFKSNSRSSNSSYDKSKTPEKLSKKTNNIYSINSNDEISSKGYNTSTSDKKNNTSNFNPYSSNINNNIVNFPQITGNFIKTKTTNISNNQNMVDNTKFNNMNNINNYNIQENNNSSNINLKINQNNESNNKNFNEIIEELLDPNIFWKLYSKANSDQNIPQEKKDEDFLKVDLLNNEKDKKVRQIIKLNIVRVFKNLGIGGKKVNNLTQKKNKDEKSNFSNPSSFTIMNDSYVDNKKIEESEDKEKVEDLIMKMTGAKEKIKTDENNSRRRHLSNLLGSNGDAGGELLLNALLNLDNNQEGGSLFTSLLNNRNGIRFNISANNTGSSNRNNNPQRNILSNLLSQSLSGLAGNRNSQVRPPVQPDQSKLQQLLEMGFEESRARTALIMSRNNLEAAVEIIADDRDLGHEEEENNQNNQSNSNENNINNIINNNNVNNLEMVIDDDQFDDDIDIYEDEMHPPNN